MVACPRRTPSLNCWRNAPQGSQTFHSKSVSATVLSKKNREPLPQQPVEAEIETLSHEGRGLAHINGKAVFVHGALAGERVLLRYTRRQRHFDEGVVTQVLHASPQRVRPRCPHADICGGCSLQHMGPSAQVSMKQEILVDVLRRIGKVEPIEWLAPLTAGHWGYRRKARLGVRYVAKKGRTLVGFRERGTSYVADLSRCEILHQKVGEAIADLAELVDGLSIRMRVPQIEMAMGDGPCVLVFRTMDVPNDADLEHLRRFGEARDLHIYLQAAGAESVRPLPGHGVDLHYSLPHFGVRIHFEPTDFTQVNLELNRLMVDRAVELLAETRRSTRISI